jgi:hypothetical protein
MKQQFSVIPNQYEDARDRRVLLAKRNAPQSLVINALRFANASYNSILQFYTASLTFRRFSLCEAQAETAVLSKPK